MSSFAIHIPASEKEASSRLTRVSLGWLAPFILTFFLYFVGSLAGFALQLPDTIHSHQISIFWPPNAVLVSLLLLLPPARWPVILLGALPAHVLTQVLYGTPAWLIGIRFANNCILTMLIASVVKTLSGQKRFSFDTLRSTILFLVVAVAIAPAIAAIFPTLMRTLLGLSTNFWEVWRSLVLSDALSISILSPILITFCAEFLGYRHSTSRPRPLRLLEFTLAFGGLAVMGFLVFRTSQSIDIVKIPALVCMPLPLLLWIVLRFGPTGTSLSFVLVAVMCIRGALAGLGPFSRGSPEENARAIQYFLLALYLPKLCLAVVMRERTTVLTALRRSEIVTREQYAQLANLYRNAPIGLSFIDTEYVYRGVNEFLAQAHGLSAAEHVGRSLDEVLSPQIAASARR
jgi:integral membrane sensor domain MASE1